MSLFRRQIEKVRSQRVIAFEATAVGIHPAETELGFGIAGTGAVAVQFGRACGILGDAFAMLVRQGFLAQRQQALGIRLAGSFSGSEGCHAQQAAEQQRTLAHQGRAAEAGGYHRQTSSATAKRETYHGIATRTPSSSRWLGR